MSYKKRLLKEKKENSKGCPEFYIQPLPDDIFKWHFTIRGQEGSPYEGGLFHGYFVIPQDYPMSPPDIYFMNENGRYQTNKKICMTITSYHKEAWSPAWTLRTMTQAIIAYFVVDDNGIGSIKRTEAQRKDYAKQSQYYKCPQCGPVKDIAEKYIN